MKSMIREMYIQKINAQMKSIVVLSLSLFLSTSLLAQDAPAGESKVTLGLRAQPSFAWLKVKEPAAPLLEGDGSKVGFAFGLMAEFKLSKNYFFATGLDVASKGGHIKSLVKSDLEHTSTTGDSLITVTSSNVSLKYIELPITLKMKTNQMGNFTYFGQFGVAPGFNISSKSDKHIEKQAVNSNGTVKDLPKDDEPAVSDVNDVDIKDNINNFNLSLVISLGIEYPLGGSTKAVMAVTFNNGFLDVFDGDPQDVISNTLGLSLGVLF